MTLLTTVVLCSVIFTGLGAGIQGFVTRRRVRTEGSRRESRLTVELACDVGSRLQAAELAIARLEEHGPFVARTHLSIPGLELQETALTEDGAVWKRNGQKPWTRVTETRPVTMTPAEFRQEYGE